MKLVHLTDLHLVPPGEFLFGLDPTDRLRRTIEQVNLDHADAELCVVTGDLTDKGDLKSYGLLSELLQELRIPFHLLLGNHDRRESYLAAFPRAERDANGFVQSVLDCSEGRLIFLDTLVEQRGYGALDRGRLEWLEARLREAPDGPVYLFAHHPLQAIGMRHFEPINLIGSEQVMQVVMRNTRVRHIFFGHVHVDVGGTWQGVPFSASRGVAHQIVPNLLRADADFVRNNPAFDIAIITDSGVLVHRFETGAREIIAVSPAIAPREEVVL